MDENIVKCKQCQMVVTFSNFCQECGNKLPKIDKCPICFEEKLLDTTKCGHSACDGCFEMWYKTNQSCPICRNAIDDNIIVSEEEVEIEETMDPDMLQQTQLQSSIDYTNVETNVDVNNKNNYIIICNLCNSNLLTDLSRSTEMDYETHPIRRYNRTSGNNNTQKIYSCRHCNNTIFSPFVILKCEYNKGLNKVKEPTYIEICTICNICNNKNFELEINGINCYKICKNCKNVKPSTRVILKKNYNKGENIVQKIIA